jgi:hypothetical protein
MNDTNAVRDRRKQTLDLIEETLHSLKDEGHNPITRLLVAQAEDATGSIAQVKPTIPLLKL